MDAIQSTFLDPVEGRRLRDEGRSRFEGDPWLLEAREVARRIAREQGTVDSDRVQILWPRPAHVHPNVVGTIFATKEWEPTGGFRYTGRTSGHSRVIRIWRLRNATLRAKV